jgi:hypothetical protein
MGDPQHRDKVRAAEVVRWLARVLPGHGSDKLVTLSRLFAGALSAVINTLYQADM